VTSREFQDRFTRRARKYGLNVGAELSARLEVYYRLLSVWNEKINLTGLPLADVSPEAIDRLLIEPLIAVKHVTAGARRGIDIGSGGGSPAIPFTLALPDLYMTLVESKTRKSVFLREAARALDLGRLEIVTARFEELLSAPALHETQDVLTIRAVRVEARALMNLQAFVKPGGELLLFRTATSTTGAIAVTPPLSWKATFPLLEAPPGRLIVLEKRSVGPTAARRFT